MARTQLAPRANVRVLCADATDTRNWTGARRVLTTFALEALPPSFVDALGEGGALLAPIGSGTRQVWTRVEKRSGTLITTLHGPVCYVADRASGSGSQQFLEDDATLDRQSLDVEASGAAFEMTEPEGVLGRQAAP